MSNSQVVTWRVGHPPEEGDYLITCRGKDRIPVTIPVSYFPDDEIKYWVNGMDPLLDDFPVLAWMPMPRPFLPIQTTQQPSA